MNKIDIFSTALKNLWRKKLRTALTILGSLIGTFSIIIMLGLSMGITKTNNAMLESIGSIYNIEVYPTGQGGWMSFMPEEENTNKREVQVTDQIVQQIERMDYVEAVMPVVGVQAEIKYRKYSLWGNIIGIDFDLAETFEKKTESGRPLNSFPKNNIFLGSGVVSDVYDPQTGREIPSEKLGDLQGRHIELIFNSFSDVLPQDELVMEEEEPISEKFVVGDILASSGNYMDDMDIILPIDTAIDLQKKAFSNDKEMMRKLNRGEYEKAIVRVNDETKVAEVQERIKELGVNTNSMQDILEGMNQSNRVIQIILGGIGSIAFFVAAIGIANTMVMSIYERVKEIGIMKVIGATVSDIKTMFLAEAAFIGLIGGILGTLFALGLSSLINAIFLSSSDPEMMADFEIYITHIPIWLIFVGIIFSTFVGIIAGYLPAVRATKISAIDAIRTE